MKYLLLLLLSLNAFAIGGAPGSYQIDVLVGTEQASTPANPASGKKKLYFKNDGKAYSLNSSGTEQAISLVDSVFGRAGAVTAQSGDYNTSQITELTNLFFTNARGIAAVLTAFSSGAGTITSSDTVLSAIQKLDGNVALKQDALANVVSAGSCTNCDITFNAKGIATAYANGSGGGGGSDLAEVTSTASAITVSASNRYYLTGTTTQSITLPSSASSNARIQIVGQSAYPFKIKSNSGAASQMIVQGAYESNTSSSSAIDLWQATSPYSVVELVYNSTSNKWTSINYINGDVIGDYNYWGNASDGDLSTSGATNITSVQDGDCVVSNYNNLTINTGHTMTLSNRARCWVIYVKGNFVNNGLLTMTDRGAKANPNDAGVTSDTPVAPGDGHAVTASGVLFRRKVSGGTVTNSATDLVWGAGTALNTSEGFQRVLDSSNQGKLYGWAKTGASGGAGVSTGGTLPGNAGSNGTTSTNVTTAGGGGSGGCYQCAGSTSGSGSAASTWSGGIGGGSSHVASGSCVATGGASYGGAGGNACVAGAVGTADTGAGAGNPQGTGAGTNNGASTNNNGSGGSLAIFVRGNISGNGAIESKGHKGQESIVSANGGGATGGGQILWLYAGTDSSTITTSVVGGAGGNGGNGVLQKAQISL